MAGINRKIDTALGDYVDNGAGSTETTRNALPVVYHQGRLRRGAWSGDSDAGIRDEPLEQAKASERTERVIKDIWAEAMAPLVEEGRVGPPEIVVEKDGEDITYEVVLDDSQTGESLRLADRPELDI
jgi:phage gp46-like protein